MVYIIQIAITMPIGILFIVFGLLLAIKQKINLIHNYHHKNVKEQDIKAYTKLWGIALIIWGICICLVGIINLISHTEFGWIAFGFGMLTCILIGNKAQKKYNGSWFS